MSGRLGRIHRPGLIRRASRYAALTGRDGHITTGSNPSPPPCTYGCSGLTTPSDRAESLTCLLATCMSRQEFAGDLLILPILKSMMTKGLQTLVLPSLGPFPCLGECLSSDAMTPTPNNLNQRDHSVPKCRDCVHDPLDRNKTKNKPTVRADRPSHRVILLARGQV